MDFAAPAIGHQVIASEWRRHNQVRIGLAWCRRRTQSVSTAIFTMPNVNLFNDMNYRDLRCSTALAISIADNLLLAVTRGW